ncbi:hypothetical protein CCP3SC1_480022 [Gammaproteobacteria bacterium]
MRLRCPAELGRGFPIRSNDENEVIRSSPYPTRAWPEAVGFPIPSS